MVRAPRKTRKELPLVQLLPNALTLAAICAGLTAIRMAAYGAFSMAIALIILAAVLDGVDGRLARALGSDSPMGAELDSLADAINFGVAPAFVLYFWALEPARELGWVAALIYALCCVLRLARFNVGIKAENATDKRFFVGVPSPLGALLALGPMFLARSLGMQLPLMPETVALWLILSGALMVSRLPSFSLKTTIYAEHAHLVLLGVTATLALLAVYPWQSLLVIDMIYLCSLVLAWRASRKARRLQAVVDGE